VVAREESTRFTRNRSVRAWILGVAGSGSQHKCETDVPQPPTWRIPDRVLQVLHGARKSFRIGSHRPAGEGIQIIGAPTSGIKWDPLERLYAFHETQAAQATLHLAKLFFSASLHTNILVCVDIGIKELRTATHDLCSEDRTKRTRQEKDPVFA